MSDTGAQPHLADPVRLNLLHASFRLANEEYARRTTGGALATEDAPLARSGDGAQAARLRKAISHQFEVLGQAELAALRLELARRLLNEIDRRIAAPGKPPGGCPTEGAISALPAPPTTTSPRRRVGLVSLPWMSPALPSIQLATLASALDRAGIGSDVHELYVDYAALIGLNLYNHLSNTLGYVPEWVFSRHYYGPEVGDDLSTMLDQHPLAEIPWPELSDVILEALEPVTGYYLDHVIESVDWLRYDVIGCSLTISQLGSSMAFVRRLKRRWPTAKVVFGGSQCAGAMGRAILQICPYVDVVVHVEGEVVLPELVHRLRADDNLEGLPGVSFRDRDGRVRSGPEGELYRPSGERLPLFYDAYFQRLARLELLNKMSPWIPFEGSRGCWYGQKVQCTFCGLHEIMSFRAWPADSVLKELERLYLRYGIGRFYAMDLILPRDFLRTLLPEITRRGHDWMFFWEMKANMRREELEVLANAGVRWVQPGIESLDADLLHLMKKGVSPLQNVQLLKWCQELGIFCGWNLLFGLPGEQAASYTRMAELIPKLSHLTPPSGGGRFQLHRFSPYFDKPEDYGIRWDGPHPMFKYAFPVPAADLRELVYLHDFSLENGAELVDASDVRTAVREWRRAYHAGASLLITVHADGSARIEDSRSPTTSSRIHDLDPAEAALYLFLDGGVKREALAGTFACAHPEPAETLSRGGRLEALLEKWLANDLLLEIDGKVVALALHAARTVTERVRSRPAQSVPGLVPTA